MDDLATLPARVGPPPKTRQAMPHEQLTQNAPPHLQEALFERARSLPGVGVAPSRVSVPGARAFVLDQEHARRRPEAFMAGSEFAHLHPPHDGSLHLLLPQEQAAEVIAKGWGELHPLARMGAMPPTNLMVFGPRDDEELNVVWRIVQASWANGRDQG